MYDNVHVNESARPSAPYLRFFLVLTIHPIGCHQGALPGGGPVVERGPLGLRGVGLHHVAVHHLAVALVRVALPLLRAPTGV